MTSLLLPPSNSAPATAPVPGALSLSPQPLPADNGAAVPETKLWKSDDGFGFRDLVDAVNPLQHLPVIGTIYRAMTGDTIGAAPRLIGGTLFGGPVGFVTSLFNALVESDTGKDVGAHVVALLDDSKDKSALAVKPAQIVPVTRMAHRDEQSSPVPAELPPVTVAQAALPPPARPAPNFPPAFPTSMHRDEQHRPAPAWLPPHDSAPVAPAQAAAIPQATQSLPANQNLGGIPLTTAQRPPSAPHPALPPGLPPAALAAALARNPAFAQTRAGAVSSQGTVATYSGGVPGAGIKGMPQPPPPVPPNWSAAGWNSAATPAIQAQQLPVAASPDQVPGAMQQALDKYDQMLKTRKPQGQQVSVLN